jgi:hypothetical protein
MMYRVDNATAVAALPTPAAVGPKPNHYFTKGDPGSGIPATILDDDWANAIQEEIVGVILASGQTLSKTNRAQLLAALRAAGVFTTPAQFDNTTKPATTEFVRISGHRYSGFTQLTSGPQTLTAAHCGQVIDLSSGYTGDITLPAASALVDGATIEIWSGATANVIVKCAGADAIFVNNASVTQLTLGPGNYVAVGGSAQLKYAAVFASSLGATCYQKLPSGLIIQCGQLAGSASADTAVVFPIAFPTAARSVVVTSNRTGGPGGTFADANNLSTNGFDASTWTATGTRVAVSAYYFAFGH